ncbi:MAG: hypothetical protein GX585_06015 [Clostridiales bacterium]|nr:hypothetical protein [Clostridiales bacterium]
MKIHEYLQDDEEKKVQFMKTIMTDIVQSKREQFQYFDRRNSWMFEDNPSFRERFNTFIEELKTELKLAIDDPTGAPSDNVRFCATCGKPFDNGFCLGGGEQYYCSEACMCTDGYTMNDFLADYAGLDYDDHDRAEKASKMTQEELNNASEENGSETYWTEWEWED